MLQPKGLSQMICFVCLPCILVLVTSVGTGNFNLFLNESETSRLLGVPGELYYARNGYVNDYALSFNLPIKTEITEIYFDWFNDHPTYLPETKMFYSLAIVVSNLHAMYQPIATIPTNGTVPTKPAGFSISLLCTGLLSIEVDVKIQLNVSSTPLNLISLDIRRRKPCLRGLQQSRAISQQRQQPEPIATGPTSVGESEAGPPKSQSIFYVGIGCSLAVVVIVAVLVLALYVSCTRSKNSRSGNSLNDKELSDEPECLISSENGHSMILSAPNAGTLGKWRSPRISTIDRNLPTEVLNLLSTIRIEPCRLSLKEIVIKGDYGRLYRGSLITGTSDLEEKDVFVKTVTEERSENMRVEQMAREGCSLLGLQHENVHSIIAACVDSFGQTLLIYPFMDEGILKMYLHEKRQSTMLTIEQLMCIAIQLTAAISYLHRNSVIHGDIATRNCLIDSCQSVRLADNALAADIFPLDYDDREDDDPYNDHQIDHRNDQQTLSSAIPTRWMAIESLSSDILTTASDVWSFGITLWELVTFAQQPYPGLESSDLYSYLQQGYRLSQPTGCPKDLYAMMLQCWTPEVRNRPTISQLQSSLHNFGTSLVRSK